MQGQKGNLVRIWVTYVMETRISILTGLGFICRSNAVPITTVAADASALEGHALSPPSSTETSREYRKQASTSLSRSVRLTCSFARRLLRAPKTLAMWQGCVWTTRALLRPHGQRTATLMTVNGEDNNKCLRDLQQTHWPTSHRPLTRHFLLNLVNKAVIKTEMTSLTMSSHPCLSSLPWRPARLLSQSNPWLLGLLIFSHHRH